MKIHTDKLTEADVHNATRAAGMRNVYADVIVRGSRSRKRSLHVKLTGNSTRAVNAGSDPYANRGRYADRAATWDEWGMVINALFVADPDAIIGQYRNRDHFRDVTFERYDALTAPYAHGNHKWEFQRVGVSRCRDCEAEYDFHGVR